MRRPDHQLKKLLLQPGDLLRSPARSPMTAYQVPVTNLFLIQHHSVIWSVSTEKSDSAERVQRRPGGLISISSQTQTRRRDPTLTDLAPPTSALRSDETGTALARCPQSLATDSHFKPVSPAATATLVPTRYRCVPKRITKARSTAATA